MSQSLVPSDKRLLIGQGKRAIFAKAASLGGTVLCHPKTLLRTPAIEVIVGLHEQSE
jgi:hypothetical protein